MQWYFVVLIIVAGLGLLLLLSTLLYKQFFKRFYDFLLSGIAILVLSPILILLIIIGAISMGGNPFFTQKRPGRNEKIFKLVKFRTMTNKKDAEGKLLPDADRLTIYGKILRKTSLDELPELFNIFVGQMSIIGPRPLLVKYLPYYSNIERKRHYVRPGLTGFSQVNGRNYVNWDDRFRQDVFYVENLSFWFDIKIIFLTLLSVVKRQGIGDNVIEDFDVYCKKNRDATKL